MRRRVALLGLIVALGINTRATGEVIAGIDHVPLAVRDLDTAQAAFTALGFAIQPGRLRDDGIRNAHVTFPEGSGIELVTASAAVDPLTTNYVRLLQQGEGPASLSLRVRDTRRLLAALAAAGLPYKDNGIPLPGLEWLVFVDDSRPATDRSEHVVHPNGATAISRVWVAPDDPALLRRVLQALGAKIEAQTVAAPDPIRAEVAHLQNGDLLILPPDEQLIPTRPIVGATFTAPRARAPARTLGLWIEFRLPAAR
jgi:catechol 2,3-dioxygenase-like lactoylglutathione lyase family enzyme